MNMYMQNRSRLTNRITGLWSPKVKGNREGQIRDMGLIDKIDNNRISCIA